MCLQQQQHHQCMSDLRRRQRTARARQCNPRHGRIGTAKASQRRCSGQHSSRTQSDGNQTRHNKGESSSSPPDGVGVAVVLARLGPLLQLLVRLGLGRRVQLHLAAAPCSARHTGVSASTRRITPARARAKPHGRLGDAARKAQGERTGLRGGRQAAELVQNPTRHVLPSGGRDSTATGTQR